MAERRSSAERQCDVRPVNVRSALWWVVGATIVLGARLGGDSTIGSTIAAAQPAGQWKDLHFASGRLGGEQADASCDFNHRLRTDREGFELVLREGWPDYPVPVLSRGPTRDHDHTDRVQSRLTKCQRPWGSGVRERNGSGRSESFSGEDDHTLLSIS